MPKKKVYLHIGTHKTGTTALQVFCARHSEKLKDLGCLYPESGRPRAEDVSYGHHLLPWSLTRHVSDPSYWPTDLQSVSDVWDALTDEIEGSDCQTVLLSSEEFDTLSPGQVGSVLQRLKAFDIKPIIFLRRLDELAQAIYTTDVVYNAESEEFAKYVLRMRTPLDYEAIVTPWLSCKPIVRYYDSRTLPSGVVPSMLALVGIDQMQFGTEVTGERVNIGAWPWYVVEVCRQMNGCNLPTRPVVVKFAYIMRAAIRQTVAYDIISPSEAARLRQKGLESLTKLGRQYPIPSIPESFCAVAPTSDDAEWAKVHNERNGAVVRTLQQLSRLVDK